MSLRFVHESQPQRVCFGSGEAAGTVARELERLGASKLMVIASERDSRLAERLTADALGAERAVDGLEEFRRELKAPRALRDYGFAESGIPAAAEAIMPAVPPGNPRPVTAGDLRRLLRAAWEGADPAAISASRSSL